MPTRINKPVNTSSPASGMPPEYAFEDEFKLSFQDYVDFVQSINYRFEKVVSGHNFLIVPADRRGSLGPAGRWARAICNVPQLLIARQAPCGGARS